MLKSVNSLFFLLLLLLLLITSTSFSWPTRTTTRTHFAYQRSSSPLHGLFDNWKAGGDGNSQESLDDQWLAQQEILRRRTGNNKEKYFAKVEEQRRAADKEQTDRWAWQKQGGSKGSSLLDAWKERRESGVISDLDDQYAEEEKKGGIAIPMASFGVGGEFGVGGKFDNGGRFDLRLPYAEAGYVDDESDWLGRKKKGQTKSTKPTEDLTPPSTSVPKFKFPWEKK